MPVLSIDAKRCPNLLARLVPLFHDCSTQVDTELRSQNIQVDDDVSQLVSEHRLCFLLTEVTTLNLLTKIGVFTKLACHCLKPLSWAPITSVFLRVTLTPLGVFEER